MVPAPRPAMRGRCSAAPCAFGPTSLTSAAAGSAAARLRWRYLVKAQVEAAPHWSLRRRGPGCWAKSWHAWRTGTATRWRRRGCKRPPRTGRTARSRRSANQVTSSSRCGPVPPCRAAAASIAYRTLKFCRPRKVHPGRNRSRSPSNGGGSPRLARTSPARPRRRGETPRRERVVSRM
jgi:hypothetical protein